MAHRFAAALRSIGTICGIALLAALLGAPAWAQARVTLRGTMTSVQDGGMIGVTMRIVGEDGNEIHLFLNDPYEVLPVMRREQGDIREGLSVTAWGVAGANQAASAIRLYASALPASAEGVRPWDRPQGSVAATGKVARIAQEGDRRSVTILAGQEERTFAVSADTSVFQTGQPSTDMSLLTPGSYLVIEAARASDGTYTTGRMMISKEGYKPAL